MRCICYTHTHTSALCMKACHLTLLTSATCKNNLGLTAHIMDIYHQWQDEGIECVGIHSETDGYLIWYPSANGQHKLNSYTTELDIKLVALLVNNLVQLQHKNYRGRLCSIEQDSRLTMLKALLSDSQWFMWQSPNKSVYAS